MSVSYVLLCMMIRLSEPNFAIVVLAGSLSGVADLLHIGTLQYEASNTRGTRITQLSFPFG